MGVSLHNRRIFSHLRPLAAAMSSFSPATFAQLTPQRFDWRARSAAKDSFPFDNTTHHDPSLRD